MFKYFRLFVDYIPTNIRFLLLFYIIVDVFFSILAVIAIIPLGDIIQNLNDKEYSIFTKLSASLLGSIGVSLNLFTASIIFIGANFVKPITNYLLQFCIIKAKYSFLHGVLNRLLEQLFKTSWGNIERISLGVVVNVFTKEIHSLGDGLTLLITRVITIIQLLAYLLVPLYVDSILTLLVFVGFILISLPFWGLGVVGKRYGQNNLRTINELIGFVTELTMSLKAVYASNNSKFALKKFNDYFNAHLSATLKSQLFDRAISVFFRPFALAIVIMILVFRFSNESDITSLITIIWSLISIVPILNQLIQNRLSFSVFEPSFNQVQKLMREFPEVDNIRLIERQEVGAPEVILENVSYRISDSDVLKDTNLEIKKGEFTCVVGASGSGKSTLIDIIIGLRKATSGNVFINGICLSEGDYFSFRNRIGFVGQETVKISGTIEENIFWKDIQCAEVELRELITAIKCEFIYDYPDGLKTLVGDNGIQLSGGQWQRLGILRALVSKPSILLLDEATSALDHKTEFAVVSGLKSLSWKPTLLMISHRQGPIDLADKVVRVGI